MALLNASIYLCVFLGYIGSSWAHLNFYINSTETRRLLGIVAELYYVNNGIINDYALNFTMPIKPDINDIYFVWQSLRTPPEPPMVYNMAISISNPQVMRMPHPSIPRDGAVPTSLSVFRVNLPCTGAITAEVDIKIQMNISIFSASNLTTLELKRKKTCLKFNYQNYGDQNHKRTGDQNHKRVVDQIGRANLTHTKTDDGGNKETAPSSSPSVFYIVVGSVCGAILLLALIVAVFYIRSHKSSSSNERLSETSSAKALTHPPQTYLRSDTPNNSISGMSVLRRGLSPVPLMELKPTDVQCMLDEVQIDRARVTLGQVLMEGTFGRIYHGTIVGEDEKELMEQEVLVKTLTEIARPDQREVMLREGCLMKGLNHQNVCPLLASCLDDVTQPFLLYSFGNEGNLKKFLQRCKISDMASHQTLNTQQLVYMAIQISRGLQYLHRKRMVHRDVATRNCIVDSALTVRLTDNALARDLFPNDYHCLGDNENRPVKWLALEALLERKFSAASDVWAFGVLLWELMTLGQQPYADIDPFEMATYLKQGYRVAQPLNCPDELFAVMACCWALGCEERPKISQLQLCLQDFYTALGRFI